MTWVLAKTFVQNYSLIIADTCVTFEDRNKSKSYVDCLLKIHDIDRDNGLMVGFSGNVENAFSIINDMKILASDMALKRKDRKFDVLDFIKEFRQLTIINKKHQYDDSNGVDLFIAGNHLEQDSVGNRYAPCGLWKIKSPNYRPMSAGHPHIWSDIGSGSDMRVCKDLLSQLTEDFRLRIAAIDVPPEKFVEFIAPRISAVLDKGLTDKGVSSNLVIGISVVGDTALSATYRADNKSPILLSDLATDYDELMNKFGVNSASAEFFA